MKRSQHKVIFELRRVKKHGKRKYVLRYGRPLKRKGASDSQDEELPVSWAEEDWNIGQMSMLPRLVFFAITSYILGRTKRMKDAGQEKSFDNMKPKIRKALWAAGPVCSCVPKNNHHGGVTWWLGKKRLIAFIVVDFGRHRNAKPSDIAKQLRDRRPEFVELEKESKALLRVAVVVLKGGLCKIVPARTLYYQEH